MRQPTVKLFGQEYKVRSIEFNREGNILEVWYYWPDEGHGVNLIIRHKNIDEPTTHPSEGYVGVPDFDDVLFL